MVLQNFHFKTIQNHKPVNIIPLLSTQKLNQNPKIYNSQFSNTTHHY